MQAMYILFRKATPVFNPKLSSSFLDVTCSSNLCKALRNSRCGNGCCEYLNVYGDGSSSQGFLSRETLTFEEQVSVPRIGFGCGVNNQVIGMNNVAGIVGLGRGTLSFVSQLGSRKFSYCFTSIGDNRSSSLLFGSLADMTVSNGAVKSTPLIRNPFLPSFYYSSLEGSDGGGGLMIDSGTTVSSLQEDAFDMQK
ncbi:aspartic proteinase nepenthesin-1-like [Castanea sativa]|uniref:aspartic proteinase nepenthesin-1-like n=1 Tax=Castanea sativa TaxID=21020 RepID=UPI003F651085